MTGIVKKSDIIKLLWKHSYGDWNNGNLGEYAESFDDYPTYLASVLLDHYKMEKKGLKFRK